MERPIVAISREDDAHLPFVERHLEKPLITIDPTTITTGNELSYEFIGGVPRVIYKGEDVSDAISVWYRKPLPFESDDLPIEEEYKHYSMSALQKHTEQLRAQLPEAQWVSDYYAIRRANNKTLQLQMAYELGMQVPDTLITSSPDAARDFLAQYPVSIVKTLATTFPRAEDGASLAFFANKVHRGEAIDLDGLKFAPAIFQEAIDAEVDVRVTVVGDKAFPATILTTDISHPHVRDWRAGHFEGSMVIEACDDLPMPIQEACIEHVKRLGLKYGAIDLVIGKDKQIWFLENNPNGQWAFVEQMTGQPIGAALAELLMRGKE